MTEPRPYSIGIVGGLSPLAAADIQMKLLRLAHERAGAHEAPDVIVDSLPKQRERGTDRLAEYPYYDLTSRMLYSYQVARSLEEREVSCILIPGFLDCLFVDAIGKVIKTPLFDSVSVLAEAVHAQFVDVKRAGILTTSLAIEKGLFEPAFAERGIELVYPAPEVQRACVTEAIYGERGLKNGNTGKEPAKLIRAAIDHLLDAGAEVIVTGVTELPLLDASVYPESRWIDCNVVIAERLLSDRSRPTRARGGQRVIGILGGLGPAATVDVFAKIVANTPAEGDQDHIRMVIENNPQIPDRTRALSGEGEDPTAAMLATAEKLEEAGADFIIIPCNTAHSFVDAVQQRISIPVINMIDAVCDHLAAEHPEATRVGLLATTGTVEAKVYERKLAARGLTCVTPTSESQERLVMAAIYGPGGIKAGAASGEPRELLREAARELVAAGAQVVVMGCTEVPLALRDGDVDVPLVDATEVLAKKAVAAALG